MKRTVLFLTLTALAFSAPAFAGSASANLNVTANVAANCTISTSPVAFGAYDPVVANASTDLTASGTVTVACTKGTAATIDLGNGIPDPSQPPLRLEPLPEDDWFFRTIREAIDENRQREDEEATAAKEYAKPAGDRTWTAESH